MHRSSSSSFSFPRVFSVFCALVCPIGMEAPTHACTTAVVSGKVTADGRPLLWKNRDTTSSVHNEVVQFTDGGYRTIAVVDAGSRKSVWMGVNEMGFCIENSLSRDLASLKEAEDEGVNDEGANGAKPKALGNGAFMKLALQTCATVEDFRKLLDETNAGGRSTTANFGVIDAEGGAAMFETGPSQYAMFDANDPTTAPQGYIVRSNFATTAKQLSTHPQAYEVADIYAGERYLRACSLIDGCLPDKVSLKYILRHMARDMAEADGQVHPGTVNQADQPLPPVIATDRTISRTTTVAAAVFQGVRPGENPAFTTMWTILGDPKFSVAVPCWVNVDAVADSLTDDKGGEIGEIAITLRDWSLTWDRTGIVTRGLPGIWEDLWPVEDKILAETRRMLDSWSVRELSSDEMTRFHHAMAQRAMQAMETELLEAKQAALNWQIDTAPLEPLRVAIYDYSEEMSNGPKNLLQFLTLENGFSAERIRPEEIRNGELERFQVLIMPGGSGSKQAEMLESAGCEAVRSFVQQGGGYVGICAGSYLASSQYTWSLGLINTRVWDRAHWARGTGTVTIGLTPAGTEFFKGQKYDGQDNVIDVYYGQGPLLVPGENAKLPSYEVLATYQTEVAKKGAPAGAMVGTHAIVRSTFGDGRVVCFSPHPEVNGGPNELITAGVLWSVAREP